MDCFLSEGIEIIFRIALTLLLIGNSFNYLYIIKLKIFVYIYVAYSRLDRLGLDILRTLMGGRGGVIG